MPFDFDSASPRRLSRNDCLVGTLVKDLLGVTYLVCGGPSWLIINGDDSPPRTISLGALSTIATYETLPNHSFVYRK